MSKDFESFDINSEIDNFLRGTFSFQASTLTDIIFISDVENKKKALGYLWEYEKELPDILLEYDNVRNKFVNSNKRELKNQIRQAFNEYFKKEISAQIEFSEKATETDKAFIHSYEKIITTFAALPNADDALKNTIHGLFQIDQLLKTQTSNQVNFKAASIMISCLSGKNISQESQAEIVATISKLIETKSGKNIIDDWRTSDTFTSQNAPQESLNHLETYPPANPRPQTYGFRSNRNKNQTFLDLKPGDDFSLLELMDRTHPLLPHSDLITTSYDSKISAIDRQRETKNEAKILPLSQATIPQDKFKDFYEFTITNKTKKSTAPNTFDETNGNIENYQNAVPYLLLRKLRPEIEKDSIRFDESKKNVEIFGSDHAIKKINALFKKYEKSLKSKNSNPSSAVEGPVTTEKLSQTLQKTFTLLER